MTANWFEVQIKHTKIIEDGRTKKSTDSYLLDAMSYTEAEARIMLEMESVINGDYSINPLKKSNITEVVYSEDENDDRWYKAKVAIIDADEISGKSKTSFTYYLVAASNINRALENLEKALATFIVPYEIASIADTPIVDVYPYISNEEEVIPENLKPIPEEK